MPRHVAFLRAINVGGRTVKMDRLRALFDGLGFEHVETFIASGNVLFDSTTRANAAMERTIEHCLETALGFRVDTFLRPLATLGAIAAHPAFAPSDREPHALYIGFTRTALDDAQVARLLALRTSDHHLAVRAREIYWLTYAPTSDSKISGATVERSLGSPVTFRNVTTVRKLAAKA